MSRHLSAPYVFVAAAGVLALACSTATAPKLLTTPYVGTYTMDSVTASLFAQGGVPNGTLDAADGVQGTLILKPDSFFIALAGTALEGIGQASTLKDSGTFTVNSAHKWTLGGSLFNGTGTGALAGTQLQLTLSTGSISPMFGLFTQQ